MERGRGDPSSSGQSKGPGGDYIGVKYRPPHPPRGRTSGAFPPVSAGEKQAALQPDRVPLKVMPRVTGNRCPHGTNRTPCSSCLIRSRSGDVPLKRPYMHRYIHSPRVRPLFGCYGTSPPSHSGKHPLLPRTQSARLLVALFCFPRMLLRPRSAYSAHVMRWRPRFNSRRLTTSSGIGVMAMGCRA